MANPAEKEVVDLLILVDATASMTTYLQALKQSLPQIISISALTNCFDRFGILAYRDYAHRELLEWSGWTTCAEMQQDGGAQLIAKANALQAISGGSDDHPEAVKTGLAQAYEYTRKEAKTLVFLYADAPPHIKAKDSERYDRNGAKEQKALLEEGCYGGYGPLFADWVSGAKTLRDGEKKVQIMPILYFLYKASEAAYLDYLAAMTNGATMHLNSSQPRTISEVTIEVLLAWMGVKKEGVGSVTLPGRLSWYEDTDFEGVKAEEELSGLLLFGNAIASQRLALTSTLLEERLPKKKTPLQDFARTYKEDPTYRDIVTTHLRAIIERDVSTMSLNPVFGSLWRTFCNDKENAHRQDLLDLFGLKINGIVDANERSRMKTWLDESYDYTAEVLEAIAAVPEELQYPCVCLDPTLSYETAPQAEGEDDEEKRPITSFKRDELLELGRSCDYRILRRLGQVLTRLTFVESADAMPAHIAAAGQEKVTKIPMALARKEYGRKFWRMLLHIVVPGTMLSGRAAALFGALAIRMGVQPLRSAAETVMFSWRDRWNDIEVPETWNVSCLSLLLDADKAYQEHYNDGFMGPDAGLLWDEDRDLFKRLVDYKMLELNLETTLHARVAWTPHKTTMPIGPVVICKLCQYPRSVTGMGPDGVCGLCCYNRDNPDSTDKADIHCHASNRNNDAAHVYWYECNSKHCRAQYIVHEPERLNVRPKCHYCREGKPAPTLECSKCLSRMIWPLEYRCGIDETTFTCVGCSYGRKTVIEVETTANRLRPENGDDWLLTNLDNKIKEPFNGRSLFNIASTSVPLEDFCDKVQILPDRDHSLHLTLAGKRIHNSASVINELRSWVLKRRTESGTCSLCFTDVRKNTLQKACGRSGCHQMVCEACSKGWYGLNVPGHILNTAALHCPFCRRAPAAKILARHGMGVHAVANLSEAVKQRGEWIFAWCIDCGHSKQYMERVCANGAPPHTARWECEECRERKAQGTAVRIKPCPGCGIETEKVSGCDHVQCVIKECGVHWCFHCGEAQEEGVIYEHMNEVHGGYYGGLEYEDEDV